MLLDKTVLGKCMMCPIQPNARPQGGQETAKKPTMHPITQEGQGHVFALPLTKIVHFMHSFISLPGAGPTPGLG